MYTYVQRPGCKKEHTATYVYIRAGSRTPTRACIRTTRARVHGWVRTEKQRRRVHGEATEFVVVFIGRVWTEQVTFRHESPQLLVRILHIDHFALESSFL